MRKSNSSIYLITFSCDFSEQQLVDCDRANNGGCNGGWYTDAWDYFIGAGGSAKRTLYREYNARV